MQVKSLLRNIVSTEKPNSPAALEIGLAAVPVGMCLVVEPMAGACFKAVFLKQVPKHREL